MQALLSLRALAAGAIAIAAGGCGDNLDGTPASCLPDCPASRGYDAQAYHLRARFDAGAGVMHASEDVALADLDSPIVELDSQVAVAKVHAGDRKLAFAVDEAGRKLLVDLGPIAGADPALFTIEYDAPTSDALVYGGARDDDPVTSKVLYTDSEPDRGLRWLPAKHDPADRALWSVEVTVAAGDDVVANGERVRDDGAGGERTVGYALAQPIPTYLMAFAAGALEHTDQPAGSVPLTLWYRRGLLIDPFANLEAVSEAMASIEQRIGPYPWSRYSVVLLPQFGGGMENATITFNAESSGQGAVSFSLNAHELSHHWFGDYVTNRSWDDLWIKEGTASFFESEAQGGFRDRRGTDRMYGGDFLFLNSTAVVDPTLSPVAKYTDGPYGRGAWVITQIRRVVGEQAFWAGLRKILADHALDSVDSEGYVRAFSPALDEATIQRVLASLRSHDGASLSITSTPNAGALDVTLGLDDPAQVLIAPIELTVVDAAGNATEHAVHPGEMTSVTVPLGGYAAPDERAVHPSWPRTFDAAGVGNARLSERIAPPSSPRGPALDAYLSRSAAHQERAIFGALAVPLGSDYRAVYDGFDSAVAQESFLTWTCSQFNNLAGSETIAVANAMEPVIHQPPLTRYNTGYMRCPSDLAVRALGAEYDAAAAAPTAANAARLEYLISFDYGTATNFAHLTALASGAPSLRLRERAVQRMIAETTVLGPHRIPDADRPAWQAFFRQQYAIVTTAGRLLLVWGGSLNLGDVAALVPIAPLLHTVPMTELDQFQIVCDAYRMTSMAPAAWARFQADTMPWETLSPAAASALSAPFMCDRGRAAVRPAAPVADDLDERARLAPR